MRVLALRGKLARVERSELTLFCALPVAVAADKLPATAPPDGIGKFIPNIPYLTFG